MLATAVARAILPPAAFARATEGVYSEIATPPVIGRVSVAARTPPARRGARSKSSIVVPARKPSVVARKEPANVVCTNGLKGTEAAIIYSFYMTLRLTLCVEGRNNLRFQRECRHPCLRATNERIATTTRRVSSNNGAQASFDANRSSLCSNNSISIDDFFCDCEHIAVKLRHFDSSKFFAVTLQFCGNALTVLQNGFTSHCAGSGLTMHRQSSSSLFLCVGHCSVFFVRQGLRHCSFQSGDLSGKGFGDFFCFSFDFEFFFSVFLIFFFFGFFNCVQTCSQTGQSIGDGGKHFYLSIVFDFCSHWFILNGLIIIKCRHALWSGVLVPNSLSTYC